MPATVDAGDLLIAFFSNDGTPDVATPGGWTFCFGWNGWDGGSNKFNMYAKRANGAEAETTVDFQTGEAEKAAAQVFRITGWRDSGTITNDIEWALDGDTGAHPNPPPLDPTGWAAESPLWIAAYGADGDHDATGFPTNYAGGTYSESDESTASASMGSARRNLDTESEDPGPFTIAESAFWLASTVAVRPAAPPPDRIPAVLSVTATSFSTDSVSHPVQLPSTVNPGDLLIIFFANDGTPDIATPSGWTLFFGWNSWDGGGNKFSMYAKRAMGTEDETTVDFQTAEDEKAAAQVYRITGWRDSGTITNDIGWANDGDTGANPNPPSLDPTEWDVESTLWIAAYGADGDHDATGYPDGYAEGTFAESDASTTSTSMALARRNLAEASEDPSPFTIAESAFWIASTVAVRPAVAPLESWGSPHPFAWGSKAMAYDSESDRIVLSISGTQTWSYDFNANAWTNMRPSTMPSSRSRFAMTYDSHSDRVILFGGSNGTGNSNETWAYDFDANSWTNMEPSPHPMGRQRHAMAYDSESERIVLFGGYNGARLNDTWAYDFGTNAWTELGPAEYPTARYGHEIAYDSTSDRVVLFGGWPCCTGPSSETWTYDLNANTWAKLTPPVSPYGRQNHKMVYDAQSNRVLLHGGQFISGAMSDLWALDVANQEWTQFSGTSSPRHSHAMAYDSESDRTILNGGEPSHWSIEPPNDTRTYDFETDTWTLRYGSPPRNRDHALAYDSESDRVVLFGGRTEFYGYTGQTWGFEVGSSRWRDLSPVSGPSSRGRHAMAYDSESDRVILFGGNRYVFQDRPLGDTWSFDLNTNSWTQMTPSVSPSNRSSHAMAYDSESDRVILFGGWTGTTNSSETWSYDFNANTWVPLDPPTAPSGRRGHSMAYDSQSDRVVLFGGLTESGMNNETWSFDFNSNAWSSHEPSVGPSARGGHVIAYDRQADRVVLFGGESSSGASGETWSYDLDANTWELLDYPAPASPSARSGHAVAYDSQSNRLVLYGGGPGPSAHTSETWLFSL